MKLSVQDNIKEIPYYPKAMMYGLEDGWVRLSSNENPYPPSPEVFSQIMDGLFYVNRYPGNEAELKAAIGKHYNVKPEKVLIGNGSNELIEMSLKAMKYGKRNKVIISDPSFAFYAIASKIYGYESVKVPLVNMKVELGAVKDLIDGNTRVIFLNNPNNPTGTIFEDKEFEAFLKDLPPDILVVVDEAYAEFVESKTFPDSFSYIDDYPVVILRTFSKAYGLAGLRIGYGVGEESIISFLERTKQPFSVNMMAIIAAKAALMDQKYLKKVLNNNRKGKRFLYAALKSLSIQFIPTEANYILMRIGPQAESITKRLFDEKILVRWMGAYNLSEYIRVGIGTMDENKLFAEALKRIL
ncbi:MAG: histidinol-phosphate aminotransferase [Deltaproteobacteria bacterium]|nr:histidinol-phosphate aminotransferase [Deltaproteobacteria bacterium]